MAKDLKDIFKDASGAGYASLAKLKPTQITVGMREVECKQEKLRAMAKKNPADFKKYLLEHPISVAKGPNGGIYVVDHHHLALTLINEGLTTVPIKVDYDFSDCATQEEFWQRMQKGNLLHLYDENGEKKSISDLPDDLPGMLNDPYRSLAWFVREAKGYDKIVVPYVEFEWATYFRERIPLDMINNDFEGAVKLAKELARDPAAEHLPGYKKPVKKSVVNAIAAAVSKKKKSLLKK